jgi:hypothetical protein
VLRDDALDRLALGIDGEAFGGKLLELSRRTRRDWG